MRIYLDLCCLKRPFDDPAQDRVRLEAEAMRLILERIDRSELSAVSSEALEAENAMNPQPERRSRASELLARFGRTFRVTPSVEDRAERLERSGFGSFDALHLACAKAAGVEVLLTCDEALRRRARASGKRLLVSVENPVDFLRRRP